MPWNWQLPNWPHFTYDPQKIQPKERKFLLSSGSSLACLRNINRDERDQFIVEILTIEGLESSKIEGEILERDSLQSSIKQQFGLENSSHKKFGKEQGMAELLTSVYKTFDAPLTHEMLWQWHEMLFRGWGNMQDIGRYRTHLEPMQIVSSRFGNRQVHFEAPLSKKVPDEMTKFIKWYNGSRSTESLLVRASLAHVYFESIHPFEDGNGRIGRVLVEKALSQGLGKPVLIAISRCIDAQRKEYYDQLARTNHTLEVQKWIEYFADVILQAQADSVKLLQFLIEKSKILSALVGKINERQEKVLRRMFAEGPDGFAGGMSAEKYIAITKASRATASRDLADLVAKGVLLKTGDLRHTRYWLKQDGSKTLA